MTVRFGSYVRLQVCLEAVYYAAQTRLLLKNKAQNQLEVIAEVDQLSDDIGIMMANTLKPMIVQIQTVTQSLRIQMETLTVTVRSALMNH